MTPRTVLHIAHDDYDAAVLVRCNLTDASSPIEVYWINDGGDWAPSRYQCADTKHRQCELAIIGEKMIADALGIEHDPNEYTWMDFPAYIANESNTIAGKAIEVIDGHLNNIVLQIGSLCGQPVYRWKAQGDDANAAGEWTSSREAAIADGKAFSAPPI